MQEVARPINCIPSASRGSMRRSHGFPSCPETYNDVPWARPIAPQSLSSGDRPAHHHIAMNFLGTRQIPTRERRTGSSREAEQSPVEPVHPLPGFRRRYRQCHQAKSRLAAHRRDVAQASGQRPFTDRIGCCGRLEMHPLDHLVGSEQQILARMWTVRSRNRRRCRAEGFGPCRPAFEFARPDRAQLSWKTRPAGSSSPNILPIAAR